MKNFLAIFFLLTSFSVFAANDGALSGQSANDTISSDIKKEELTNSFEKRQDFFRIYVVNKCWEMTKTWIHYRDFNNNWVTKGYWETAPNGGSSYIANTKNGIIYLYAEVEDGSYAWSGDRVFTSESGKHLSMREINLNMSRFGDYTYTYKCTNH